MAEREGRRPAHRPLLPGLGAGLAGFGLRRMLAVAAWRHQREEANALRRPQTGQVFRAFIQVNISPRSR